MCEIKSYPHNTCSILNSHHPLISSTSLSTTTFLLQPQSSATHNHRLQPPSSTTGIILSRSNSNKNHKIQTMTWTPFTLTQYKSQYFKQKLVKSNSNSLPPPLTTTSNNQLQITVCILISPRSNYYNNHFGTTCQLPLHQHRHFYRQCL